MKSFLKRLLISELPILIGAGIIAGVFLHERHNQNPEPETTVIEEEKQEQPSEQAKILLDQNAKIAEAYGNIYGQKERLEAENLQLKGEVDRLKNETQRLKNEIQHLKSQLDIFNRAQLESLKNQLDR